MRTTLAVATALLLTLACSSTDAWTRSLAGGRLAPDEELYVRPVGGEPWTLAADGPDLRLELGGAVAVVADVVAADGVEYRQLPGRQPRYALTLADGRRAEWNRERLVLDEREIALMPALRPVGSSPTALAAPAVAATPAVSSTVRGVVLRAESPQELARWYADVLGLSWREVAPRTFLDDSGPIEIWIRASSPDDDAAAGTTTLLVRLDDLEAGLERLAAAGSVPLERRADTTGSVAVVLDPAGHCVELYESR